ncbi:MAG: right-handed parallel beta-helix repeat-containing protein [Candidatus Helarchaeota archaeon]
MKLSTKILSIFAGLFLILSILIQVSNISIRFPKDSGVVINFKADPPIDIQGDSGFIGYPGSGTIADPYRIENLIIDGGGITDCIKIADTTKHCIIQNCILYNGDYGIFLDNTTNIQVINNTIYNMDYSGIIIYSNSKNNRIFNNTCYSNIDHGIYLFSGVLYNTIERNICYNNTRGIFIYQGSNENDIFNNTLYSNEEGILIQISYNNSILRNNITRNNIGIFLSSGDNTTIYHNIVNNNNDTGIYVYDSDNNRITWNNVHGNIVCINITTGSTGNIAVNNSCYIATLTNGNVSPSEGTTSITFTYSVTYTDADNMAPIIIQVIINGIPHNMTKLTPSDNTYTDGCIYVFQTTLGVGSLHTYHFEVIDILILVRSPNTGENLGPTVLGGSSGNIPGFILIFGIFGILILISNILYKQRRKNVNSSTLTI